MRDANRLWMRKKSWLHLVGGAELCKFGECLPEEKANKERMSKQIDGIWSTPLLVLWMIWWNNDGGIWRRWEELVTGLGIGRHCFCEVWVEIQNSWNIRALHHEDLLRSWLMYIWFQLGGAELMLKTVKSFELWIFTGCYGEALIRLYPMQAAVMFKKSYESLFLNFISYGIFSWSFYFVFLIILVLRIEKLSSSFNACLLWELCIYVQAL